MKFIYNNPFRVLGISVDATEKEKARNISLFTAYLAANKQVRFDSDMSLPIEVERTLETIQDAESKIQQPNGRLRHAHLWFWDGNPVDTKAFQLIRDGAPDKGVALLLQNVLDKDISPNNYSSYRNLAIYYLSMLGPGMEWNEDVAAAGLKFLGQFVCSDYFEEYSKRVLGDHAFIDRDAAIQDLCGLIFDPFKRWVDEGKMQAEDFVFQIDGFPEIAKRDIKNRFTNKPIQELNEAIEKAQNAIQASPVRGYAAGKKLIETAKPLLEKLVRFFGESDYRYESHAQDAALQIRACSHAYWKTEMESGETDPGAKCQYLTQSAYAFCYKGKTGDLLKNDVKHIQEWNAGARGRKNEEEVRPDIEFLAQLLDEYEGASGPSLCLEAHEMLEKADSRLCRIGEILGRENNEYLKMSTVVASHILGMLIKHANEYASSARVYSKVKKVMVELGKLDMEPSFRIHWQTNLYVIESNATTSRYSSSGSGSGCLVAIVCVLVIGFIIYLFDSNGSGGSNFQTTIPYNGTPLHQAALIDEKRVEKLIRDGADVNAKDDNGETPLDWAIELDMDETANLLRRYGGTATKKVQPASTYSSPSTARKTQPPSTYSSRSSSSSYLTPQTTPRHGKVLYESGEKIAPFKIKVPYGSDNYYVKLEDWYTGRKIMVFFVNGRSVSHTLDVPTGTFRLKYASGETWYGEKDLFGPNTSYNQADSRMTFEVLGNRVSSNTVELIKQEGGNLRTSKLNAANF